MKFTQFEIYESEGEIVFVHDNPIDDSQTVIYITADMVDSVCNELQRLKAEIQRSGK